MAQYSFEIPNEKAKIYRVITLMMLLLNLLLFAFVFLYSITAWRKVLSITGFILNISSIILYVLRLKNVAGLFPKKYNTAVAFIISASLWLLLGKYLLSCMLLLFALFGLYASRKFIIQFSEEGIRYPSFPPKLFLWKEVEQALLKDDILTIDMRDNRLLQFPVDKRLSNVTDEQAFNNFCSGQPALS